ncbi:hypothetical protein [Streptomyces fungicidicus]|uniref:Uncharacterized protein n=1 Tax=Streptomyces fungicidicus TaxID=68203 RepID=A0A494UQT3_9ACTN|nr:hypothetical protein [Streptomyces fungicidicus]AYL37742.1 hypothetical protein CNQ36_21445 [Streptomyces fungicidicus]
MVTALAAAVLFVSAALLLALALLIAVRGRKSTAQAIKQLPEPLDAFLGRVGRRLVSLWRTSPEGGQHEGQPAATPEEARVGVRLRFIGAFLPDGEKWRLEETMNHRNELRKQGGRLPRFYYLVSFAGACRMRWETWADPKRQVD